MPCLEHDEPLFNLLSPYDLYKASQRRQMSFGATSDLALMTLMSSKETSLLSRALERCYCRLQTTDSTFQLSLWTMESRLCVPSQETPWMHLTGGWASLGSPLLAETPVLLLCTSLSISWDVDFKPTKAMLSLIRPASVDFELLIILDV